MAIDLRIEFQANPIFSFPRNMSFPLVLSILKTSSAIRGRKDAIPNHFLELIETSISQETPSGDREVEIKAHRTKHVSVRWALPCLGNAVANKNKMPHSVLKSGA